MTDLLPCEHCGGNDLDCMWVDWAYRVVCLTDGCDAMGPRFPDEDTGQADAIAAWNIRAARPVMVKPLEWEKWEHSNTLMNGRLLMDRALTRVGNFFLWQRPSDGGYCISYDLLKTEQHYGETPDAAKQEAEKEYARRVMACLEERPVTVQDAAKVLLGAEHVNTHVHTAALIAFRGQKGPDSLKVWAAYAAALRAIAQEGEAGG